MTKGNIEEYVDKAVDFPPISHQELASELNRLNSRYRVLMGRVKKLKRSAEVFCDEFFEFITDIRHLRMRVLMTKDKED
jgi:hypothetical protein